VVDDDRVLGRRLESDRREGIPITVVAHRGGRETGLVFEADHGDAAATGIEQVFRESKGCRDVIGGDVVGNVVDNLLADEHEGSGVGASAQLFCRERLEVQNDPVDEERHEPADHLLLGVGRAAGLLDEHSPALCGGGLDDVVGEFGEVRVVETGKRESDESAAPSREAACRDVHAVIQLCEGRFDL
jgi:hypothetical protein